MHPRTVHACEDGEFEPFQQKTIMESSVSYSSSAEHEYLWYSTTSDLTSNIIDTIKSCKTDTYRLQVVEQHWNDPSIQVLDIIETFSTDAGMLDAFEILSKNPNNKSISISMLCCLTSGKARLKLLSMGIPPVKIVKTTRMFLSDKKKLQAVDIITKRHGPRLMSTMNVYHLLKQFESDKTRNKALQYICDRCGSVFFTCEDLDKLYNEELERLEAMDIFSHSHKKIKETLIASATTSIPPEKNSGMDGMCVICLSNKATRIAIPCGHVSHCETCNGDLATKGMSVLRTQSPLAISSTTCFICRGTVVQFIKILTP
jgi:hypothetical protein